MASLEVSLMPGQIGTLVKAGALEADTLNALNSAFSSTAGVVGTPVNATAVPFGNYTTGGTVVTLVPAGAAAGTYRVNIFAVVTTTFVTATTVGHTIGWTDDQGAHTQANALSALTAGTFQTVSTIVRSTGAAAITVTEIATVASATAGAMALSAFVERLV
jgi:hypothetical protein